MSYNPADKIQELQHLGEFGGVNPSISDSSTYTFLSAQTMADTFAGKAEGNYLYSRHSSPSNLYLGEAMAAMEATESAAVAASGMGAISACFLQLCQAGDHIVSSRTVYGGTYALLKNFLPRLAIDASFVDITDLEKVEACITPRTKVLFCETVSNPLLEVADISGLAKIAKKHDLQLVVDNTFSPLSITPVKLGADIVIHSLTKFINGTSDTVGGVVCGSSELIDRLRDVNNGALMLLGSTMDGFRAASVLKNLRTLHLRMQQHSKNTQYLAEKFHELGLRTVYPGLTSHPDHQVFKKQLNEDYGFGGLLTIDVSSLDKAHALMELMQEKKLGYLAVSLGFYKTLFSAPGSSTSSEVPEEEQQEMQMSKGLIRFSVGLDPHIDQSFKAMKTCMEEVGISFES